MPSPKDRLLELIDPGDRGGDGIDLGDLLKVTPAGASSGQPLSELLALSVHSFGAIGDGIVDDTAAIQAAVAASNGDLIFLPGKTYKVNGTITLTEGVKRVIAHGAKIVQHSALALWYKVGSLSLSSNSVTSAPKGATFVGISSTAGYAVDDWVLLRSNDLTPNVTAGSRVAMLRRLTSVNDVSLRFDAAVYRDMSTSVTVRKATLGGRVVFEGGDYTHANLDSYATLFDFVLCYAPDFNGVTIHDLGSAAIRLAACVEGSFNHSHIYNLRDDADTSHFGYGINLSGPTRGFKYNSGSTGRVRHAITTTSVTDGGSGSVPLPSAWASVLSLHGEPEACYVGPVYVYATTNAAFDCHEQGYGFTIEPNAHGCFEGLHIRASDMHVTGGQLIGCRRNAVRISLPASNSAATVDYKITMNGLYINGVGLDGSGGTESRGIDIVAPGVELHMMDCTIKGYKVNAVHVPDGSKIIVDGGLFDGLTPETQTAFLLESSGNAINSAIIRNNAVGIREEAGCTGNSWSRNTFSGNTLDESRVPTYSPKNRHNNISGAAGALNEHEVPFSYFRVGAWYSGSFGGTSTSATLGVGSFRAAPFFTKDRITLDRIGAEITVAGSAGALLRLGIYKDGGQGYPDTLILDAGTIDATVVAAAEKTISQVLEPGLYWIGAAIQGAPATSPTVRTNTGGPPSIGANSLSAALQTTAGISMASVTDALPATFTAGQQPVALTPRVAVRIA